MEGKILDEEVLQDLPYVQRCIQEEDTNLIIEIIPREGKRA